MKALLILGILALLASCAAHSKQCEPGYYWDGSQCVKSGLPGGK